MRLFELAQIVDEGPRQDRVAQLFNEYKDILDTKGPTEFRRAVMNALMAEFNCSQANASNVYTSYMKQAGVAGLSNAERRAAAGKEPVKARVKGGALPTQGKDLTAQGDIPQVGGDEASEDAIIKSIIADTEQLGGIDNPEGYTDEDDIDWQCTKNGDNVTIEYAYQFNHMPAVKAIKLNRDEISSANGKLSTIGNKYRDRVISYSPATIERAVKDDEAFKGSPSTTRRLRGKLELRLL